MGCCCFKFRGCVRVSHLNLRAPPSSPALSGNQQLDPNAPRVAFYMPLVAGLRRKLKKVTPQKTRPVIEWEIRWEGVCVLLIE